MSSGQLAVFCSGASAAAVLVLVLSIVSVLVQHLSLLLVFDIIYI